MAFPAISSSMRQVEGATEMLGTPGSHGRSRVTVRVLVAKTTHGLNRSATDTPEDAMEEERERDGTRASGREGGKGRRERERKRQR